MDMDLSESAAYMIGAEHQGGHVHLDGQPGRRRTGRKAT
jgi:hypothetical protein